MWLKCPLFKLYSPRWFTCQIVEYSIDSSYLVDNSAHNSLKHLKRYLCRLSGHKVDGVDCAECNGIIISTLIAHYTDRTHVGESGKILVRHPGRDRAVFASVCLNCLVNLLAVDCIGVLNDADLLSVGLTDNSYAKTRTREWLAEYKALRNTKLKAGLADLILEKVAERFNNLLEIYEIRKTADIVVGLDYRGFAAKT